MSHWREFRVLACRGISRIPSHAISERAEGHKSLLEAARTRDGILGRREMVGHLRVGYESSIEWITPRE